MIGAKLFTEAMEPQFRLRLVEERRAVGEA